MDGYSRGYEDGLKDERAGRSFRYGQVDNAPDTDYGNGYGDGYMAGDAVRTYHSDALGTVTIPED